MKNRTRFFYFAILTHAFFLFSSTDDNVLFLNLNKKLYYKDFFMDSLKNMHVYLTKCQKKPQYIP